MATKIQYIKQGGKLLPLLKFSYYSILIFMIFINAIILSIEAKDFTPFIINIGGKFLLTTLDIRDLSQQVIDNKGIYDNSEGFFKGSWDSILLISDFISSIPIVWYWLKFLVWFIDRFTPLGVYSFVSWFTAILVFIILQIIFILMLLANIIPNVNLSTFNLDIKEGDSVFLIPFKSFAVSFDAIKILISPIDNLVKDDFNKIGNITKNIVNISSQTIQTLNNTNTTV